MKLIKRLCWLVVLVALGFGIYEFFFNCEKFDVDFNQNFTLSKFDWAEVKDEAYVKLLSIEDHRCKEETCEREGQIEYNLVVLNNMRVRFVTLSTLETPNIEIKKTDYTLHLVEGIDENHATFKLTTLAKEDK